jgi:hypothetical protein
MSKKELIKKLMNMKTSDDKSVEKSQFSEMDVSSSAMLDIGEEKTFYS